MNNSRRYRIAGAVSLSLIAVLSFICIAMLLGGSAYWYLSLVVLILCLTLSSALLGHIRMRLIFEANDRRVARVERVVEKRLLELYGQGEIVANRLTKLEAITRSSTGQEIEFLLRTIEREVVANDSFSESRWAETTGRLEALMDSVTSIVHLYGENINEVKESAGAVVSEPQTDELQIEELADDGAPPTAVLSSLASQIQSSYMNAKGRIGGLRGGVVSLVKSFLAPR